MGGLWGFVKGLAARYGVQLLGRAIDALGGYLRGLRAGEEKERARQAAQAEDERKTAVAELAAGRVERVKRGATLAAARHHAHKEIEHDRDLMLANPAPTTEDVDRQRAELDALERDLEKHKGPK